MWWIHIPERTKKFQIVSLRAILSPLAQRWNTTDYIYLAFRNYIYPFCNHCPSILLVVLYIRGHTHTSQIKYIKWALWNTIHYYIQYLYLRINHCGPSGAHVTTEPKMQTLAWEAFYVFSCMYTFDLVYCSCFCPVPVSSSMYSHLYTWRIWFIAFISAFAIDWLVLRISTFSIDWLQMKWLFDL